jgi:hypothetical protein
MSLEYGLRDTEIAEYTRIHPRIMWGLCKLFRETGEVVKKPVVSSCPRRVNLLDAMVSDGQFAQLHALYFVTVSRRPC